MIIIIFLLQFNNNITLLITQEIIHILQPNSTDILCYFTEIINTATYSSMQLYDTMAFVYILLLNALLQRYFHSNVNEASNYQIVINVYVLFVIISYNDCGC